MSGHYFDANHRNEGNDLLDKDEKDFSNEENGNKFNFKNDNISSLFIGYNQNNKNRKEISDNLFNK